MIAYRPILGAPLQRDIERGKSYIYGIKDVRPIVDLPYGARVTIRMREDAVARAFVKIKDRLECWLLMPADEQTPKHPQWKLGRLVAVNKSNA